MSDLTRRKKGRRWQPKPSKVLIGFAVNDPDNGLATDECMAVDFPSTFLELASNGVPRRFHTTEDSIILSGKRWPVIDWINWYGNWCWDAYWMRPDVAARFLMWLRKRDLFDAEGGWEEIGDWWDGDGPEFTLEDLEAKLIEAQMEWKP